ncbi:glycosyltransferase family 2 protein [Modestobacter sp. VKM Ac-2979]|uniref:glycosyltransferase family 2 protein n=1 Tax=unclassified Modestobacter TaxID=2643866 RepID=UPI0022AB6AB6|nr:MULTISPECIES: glycosyltransferase family 2 protein [unclassified Modestobacter]MCZ2813420.1 glycosyltransferase family 2 protein [Modestobacter sp. VKM Ac-2979]MCZ2842388.1 glycosyltransferase family 2 protein [Modestobacter sp. VKM Ac-2980]
MTQPDVSILIVAYNAAESLSDCLESLAGSGKPVSSSEIIVVDNASEPSLVGLIERYVGRSQVIRLDENIGFGRACNLAASRSTGRNILLLNPDTIAHSGAIDTLLTAVREVENAGMVGGRTVTPSGDHDPRSCWGEPTMWSQLCFATGLSRLLKGNSVFDPESLGDWKRDTVRDVPVVTGCLALVPRNAWSAVGGFDMDYFMYGEDADLSKRLRRSGLRVWIEPGSVVTHVVGASSPNSGAKTTLLLAGRVTYLRKNFSVKEFHVARMLLTVGVAWRALGAGLLRRRDAGWLVAWRQRRQWLNGYPPYNGVDQSVPHF